MLRKLLHQSRTFQFHRPISKAYFAAPSPPPCYRSNRLPSSTFQFHRPISSSSSSSISIDRSGLYNPPDHSHHPTSDSELVNHLKGIIKFRGGPISLGEYMSEVLTNPKAGYYINRDVFGADGDFITSPEVSQMFGEMIGVWVMCLWEQMGQPQKVNLIELGPGRGTLMADLLRGTSKLRKFIESLHVHLVECSPALQKLQHLNLKCIDEENASQDTDKRTVSYLVGAPVSWHATLEQVPSGLPTIIIAHEFFDALPVHQFQVTENGKQERHLVATVGKFSMIWDFQQVKNSAHECYRNQQGLKSCYCYKIVLKDESIVESRFMHDNYAVSDSPEAPLVVATPMKVSSISLSGKRHG